MKKFLLLLFCSFAFGQASNEMVTFTQAQSLGFSLNSGQSHVTSSECMTKTQALAKYNLDASAMSAYASNQLVPKSAWAAGTPPITFTPIGGFWNAPCMVEVTMYQGSDGNIYDSSYGLYNGYVYGNAVYDDTHNRYAWEKYSIISGYISYVGGVFSPCGPF